MLEVEGMSCAHCETVVHRAIRAADPAARVTVDRSTDWVVVETAAAAEAVQRAIMGGRLRRQGARLMAHLEPGEPEET